MKLLLARNDVNADRPDGYGRTPLWSASSEGREGVVKLLLARDDVDLNKPDNYDWTPLMIASFSRHRHIVALLQSEAISISVD